MNDSSKHIKQNDATNLSDDSIGFQNAPEIENDDADIRTGGSANAPTRPTEPFPPHVSETSNDGRARQGPELQDSNEGPMPPEYIAALAADDGLEEKLQSGDKSEIPKTASNLKEENESRPEVPFDNEAPNPPHHHESILDEEKKKKLPASSLLPSHPSTEAAGISIVDSSNVANIGSDAATTSSPTSPTPDRPNTSVVPEPPSPNLTEVTPVASSDFFQLEVQARLVPDPENEENPVYDAVAVRASEEQQSTLWTRRQIVMGVGLLMLVGAMSATIGAVVASNNGEDSSSIANNAVVSSGEMGSSSPTRSLTRSPTSLLPAPPQVPQVGPVPPQTPSLSNGSIHQMSPTANPTLSPTSFPSQAPPTSFPSQAPSMTPTKCLSMTTSPPYPSNSNAAINADAQEANFYSCFSFQGPLLDIETMGTPSGLEGKECGRICSPDVAIDGNSAVVVANDFKTVHFLREVFGEFIPTQSFELSSTIYDADISGNIAVVGVPLELNSDGSTGAVHIFERDTSGAWYVAQILSPSVHVEDVVGSLFGTSVDVDGDIIVVGAPYTEDDAKGFVSVYRRTESGWEEETLLERGPNDSSQRIFGTSVSVRADLGIISVGDSRYGRGSKGAVFVYLFDSTSESWMQMSGHVSNSEDCERHFAYTQALSPNGDLLIACPRKESWSGAIYYYKPSENGCEYEFHSRIMASDFDSNDRFAYGDQIAVDGNVMVVGTGTEARGKVYLFVKEEDYWLQMAVEGGPSDSSYFGYEVALSGNKLIVHAREGVYL